MNCPPTGTQRVCHSSPNLCCCSSLLHTSACSQPSLPVSPVLLCSCCQRAAVAAAKATCHRACPRSSLLRCPSPAVVLLKTLHWCIHHVQVYHGSLCHEGLCHGHFLGQVISLHTGCPEICLGTFLLHFNNHTILSILPILQFLLSGCLHNNFKLKLQVERIMTGQ